MCGRFNLHSSMAVIVQQLLPTMDTKLPDIEPRYNEPRYNIAPTQQILALVGSEAMRRELTTFRWGLVPSWADDAAIGNRMINARAETVAEKPSFRAAFKTRRCIIPVDGYYEWEKTVSGKQPYEFSDSAGRLLPLAGLWEINRRVGSKVDDSNEGVLRSCTILTTTANQCASTIHDRMPVILNEGDFERWLDPTYSDTELLKTILRPADEDRLKRRPVSKKVNNVRNQGIELLNSD